VLELVADVGNTRAKLALFEGEDLLGRVGVLHADELAGAADALLAGRQPDRWVGASVAPERAQRVADWAKSHGGTFQWLGRELANPAQLQIDPASGVGADRVANAAWSLVNYPGQAVVLFDLGTAITLDAVDASGRFRGGAIAAGIALRARALHDYTALLPEVGLGAETPPALGTTTEECLQGGLFWGTVGLVNALADQARRELGAPQAPLVLTGGDAPALAAACQGPTRLEPEATLRGVLAVARGAL
jgi:type III pantothenate kinase